MLARFTIRRPSPALGISCIALFVALSGVAYAAALPKNSVGTKQIKTNGVGSSEIKAKAVSASEVKDNSLGGDDIDESKLGTVPSATNATSASNASTVNGNTVTKIDRKFPSNTASSTIYSSGPFTLKAGCGAGSTLILTASTSINSDFRSYTINPFAFDGAQVNTYLFNSQEEDIFSSGDGDLSLLNIGANPEADENDMIAHFVYSGGGADSHLVQGELDIDEPEGAAGSSCAVRGFISAG